jgi:hypothetical protein
MLVKCAEKMGEPLVTGAIIGYVVNQVPAVTQLCSKPHQIIKDAVLLRQICGKLEQAMSKAAFKKCVRMVLELSDSDDLMWKKYQRVSAGLEQAQSLLAEAHRLLEKKFSIATITRKHRLAKKMRKVGIQGDHRRVHEKEAGLESSSREAEKRCQQRHQEVY